MKILLLIFFCATISLVHSQSLRLLHPNGGEKYLQGNDILIQWEGSQPTDLHQLEYSTNSGVDWRFIDTARGSTYLWKNVPKETSKQTILRVKLLDIDSDVNVITLNGHKGIVPSICFSQNGKMLVSSSINGEIKIWSTVNGEEIQSINGHSKNRIIKVRFSQDDTKIISCGTDNNIKFWNINNGEEINSIFVDHFGIRSFSISNDYKYIATCGNDNSVKIWSYENGHLLHTLVDHKQTVYDVNFSLDDKILISVSDDYSLKVWDVINGNLLNTFKSLSRPRYIKFNKDYSTFVTGNTDNTINLWNIETGKIINRVTHKSSWISDLTICSQGNFIATGGWERELNLWDIVSGIKVKSLKGHDDHILNTSISYDNLTLASCGIDSTIKIWSLSRPIYLDQDQSDSTFTLYEEITNIENTKENNQLLTVVQKENSASLEIILDLSDNGISTVKIFNSSGMLLDTKEVTSLGSQKILLNTDSYSSGTYHVILTTPTRTETASFIVVK